MLNNFDKALLRANVLGNIINLMENHSYCLYSTRTTETGEIVPDGEDDVYRMEIVEKVRKALERLL